MWPETDRVITNAGTVLRIVSDNAGSLRTLGTKAKQFAAFLRSYEPEWQHVLDRTPGQIDDLMALIQDADEVLPGFLDAGVSFTDVAMAYEPHLRALLRVAQAVSAPWSRRPTAAASASSASRRTRRVVTMVRPCTSPTTRSATRSRTTGRARHRSRTSSAVLPTLRPGSMNVETVVEKVEDDGQQQRERLYRLLIVVLVGVLIVTWVAVIWLVQGKKARRTT